eukprot:CAMPEP_0178401348 /NCGR_PEP_ID=MMETSP0689_2-20121128/16256_1 /TAXON_ID=160604 /ORGANISM="Amphidinium massartii, Strain CS-259" /LENGTH=78 /DNA_ID=CAMNT_0020022167 /DNA_START=17 /DNA_END=250 /DNA_ORIENTATION=-
MASRRNRQLARAALLAVAAAVLCTSCLSFVAPSTGSNALSARSVEMSRGRVAMESMAGEYKGFVPDMQRRTLMNLVCV